MIVNYITFSTKSEFMHLNLLYKKWCQEKE